MKQEVFQYNQNFTLESGVQLPYIRLAYTTYGEINAAKDNVVWIFHALTANSQPHEWWAEMLGAGNIFDPAHYFIICVNMPGSCYGSIAPLDINPSTQAPFYHEFPFFTTRDMIRTYQLLKKELGIGKIYIGIGGSMGGQQALEWAVEEPAVFENIIVLATNAIHSAWGKAFNASQRMAIEADSTWQDKTDIAGINGMKAARSIALLSYRNAIAYNKTQTDKELDALENYRSESYQKYQGQKLANRFNAFSYYNLSKSMDAHNVGRGRGGVETALASIQAKTLVFSLEEDMLFPVQEQKYLAAHIPGAVYQHIHSDYGHDGFLLEFDQISKHIKTFLGK